MTAPTFWDVPETASAPPQRPKSPRRVLVDAPALSEPREPAAFVQAMLSEYAAALSCYRRSKCMAAKPTTSGEEQREIILTQMDDALRRMATVEKRLAERCVSA